MPILDFLPCGHDVEPERAPLDSIGSVYSWTRSRLGQHEVLIVMADFFEGALRVTAPLLDDTEPAIGKAVRLVSGTGIPYAFELVS